MIWWIDINVSEERVMSIFSAEKCLEMKVADINRVCFVCHVAIFCAQFFCLSGVVLVNAGTACI
jgi:hypothetical protein